MNDDSTWKERTDPSAGTVADSTLNDGVGENGDTSRITPRIAVSAFMRARARK